VFLFYLGFLLSRESGQLLHHTEFPPIPASTGFLSDFSRTWKVLKNEFGLGDIAGLHRSPIKRSCGPGKYWISPGIAPVCMKLLSCLPVKLFLFNSISDVL